VLEVVGHVAFTAKDVIRLDLVGRIVEAYDQAKPVKREPRE
jgi:phosphate starvation-inducible protein PhoH